METVLSRLMFSSYEFLSSGNPVGLSEFDASTVLNFTYSAAWFKTNGDFESRFEHYLDQDIFQHKVHWFAIVNSFVMALFLAGLAGLVLFQTLGKDITRYEQQDSMLMVILLDLGQRNF